MADKPTIDSVTTFVAVLPGDTLEKILVEKFQGKKTPRTLAAARRIQAKKQVVKIPRNLLRQLWRTIGGWYPQYMKAGGWDQISRSSSYTYSQVTIGDLKVIVQTSGDCAYYAWLEYRSRKVAMLDQSTSNWLSYQETGKRVKAIGTPYTG